MNGADALIETLIDNDVTACFANPGTSEMQFVSALDRQPKMRPVLCLFEGVATGAADGFGRVAGKGRLAVGWDADLTIVDLKARRTIRHADMATRVGWTPFDGMEAKGWPMATILRGQTVMRDGELLAPSQGRPIRFLENLGA